jgi:L-lactate dehydrogenase complex protein LldG
MKTNRIIRDHILGNIRSGLSSGSLCEAEALFQGKRLDRLNRQWEEIGHQQLKNLGSLVQAFQRECEALGIRVHCVTTDRESRDVVSAIIRDRAVKRVIEWGPPFSDKLGLGPMLSSMNIEILPLSPEGSNRDIRSLRYHQPIQADLGITGSDYGLADSGTLVLKTRPEQARIVSLFPPVHIAFLESKKILPGLDELLVRVQLDLKETGGMNPCLTLITGPSKTADIEFNLVTGVHGPRELHVVILFES